MSYHMIFTSQYSNHDTEMRFKRTWALCAAEAPVSGYIITTLCLEEVLSDYIYSQFWYPQELKNELGAYFVRSWKYRLFTIYHKFRLGCHNGNKRLFASSD